MYYQELHKKQHNILHVVLQPVFDACNEVCAASAAEVKKLRNLQS